MSRYLQVTVMLPDEMTDEEFANLEGAQVSVEGDSIPPDIVPFIILSVAESLTRRRIEDTLLKQNPMLSDDYIRPFTDTAARLQMIDDLMHLPMRSVSD